MLTDLQKRKLTRMFNAYDADHSGYLEFADLEAHFNNLAQMREIAVGSSQYDLGTALIEPSHTDHAPFMRGVTGCAMLDAPEVSVIRIESRCWCFHHDGRDLACTPPRAARLPSPTKRRRWWRCGG